MSKTTLLKPRMSEKSYGLSESENTYVFDVPARTNSHEVMRAIKAQYEVEVIAVRVAKTASKQRRSYRRRGRVSHKGESAGIRKAYVTLKEGAKLPIFAAAEEAEKADKKKKESK